MQYVGGSRRELSGVKELVTSRRVQKRPSANVVRSDGGCIGGSPGSGGVIAGGLLGGCSGGNDALAELTIEDLASLPAGNHTSANHTGHSSHHKILLTNEIPSTFLATAYVVRVSRSMNEKLPEHLRYLGATFQVVLKGE
ncbi:uncharacterized protein LOC128892765 [Hylaeus anthracinus]|uniref:uncharacterized protein LOC128892764 n=1 Tax=Hylaeus anthracinus TaxID=313031 RepID=UPI0023BA024C|nr:uncharacterized protein LOC128892764 [Hylaeus anthracinus]XP_054009281.1 uncharacterized protein LOC128892765 [Hylaeus anthracinus]